MALERTPDMEGLSPSERAAIYKQITKIAYDEVPELYIDQRTSFFVMRSWVHGWYYNPILADNLNLYALSKE